jgi:hypothetical protein
MRLRAGLVEHLSTALVMAEEARDSATAYLIERALDQARCDHLKELAADFRAVPKKDDSPDRWRQSRTS